MLNSNVIVFILLNFIVKTIFLFCIYGDFVQAALNAFSDLGSDLVCHLIYTKFLESHNTR